jgi:hypothetical protein
MCTRPGVEGNDGFDVAIHEILIYANGIMSRVIDSDSVVNLPFQTILPES